MKLKALILILFAGFSISLYSQDSELDRYSFETQDVQQETLPYFGVGGGYTLTFHFANYDAVNQLLKDKNFNVGQLDGQLLLNGGEGMTGVLFIPNVRATVFSYGGNKELSKDTSISNIQLKRTVKYSVSYTGFSIDYGFVLFKSLAILPGVCFGAGSIGIDAIQTPVSSDWSNFKPENQTNTFYNKAESNFLFIKPTLNIEYALTNFLMFRGSIAYDISFSQSWNYNYNATLSSVPDSFNPKALQVQLGVFVGLFNY